MDAKKRRSVLRKSTTVDFVSTDATPRLKRRISFSGKHLVREFQSEEEPKTWNNSYEISDHLHADETATNICVSKNKSLRSALKKPREDKENVQVVSHSESQNHRNVAVTNNSVLSTTRDLINVSYKKYNIENSVDITLFERELKYRVGSADDQTTTYINSFSLDENEKELASIGMVERTVDFMRNGTKYSLNNDLTLQQTSNMLESSMMDECTKNDGGFTVYSEFTDGIQNMEVTCAENKRSKEHHTIYMNDSMSTSCIEQPAAGAKKTLEKRKTMQRPVPMECSPINVKQCDKENIIPMTLNGNATINKSCYMELESHRLGHKIQEIVDKESREFHEKLDQLSFVRQSDDNMQMDLTQTSEVCRGGAIPKAKSRPTINFNQPIEFSPVKDKSNAARQTVNCNVDIHDVSKVKFKTNPKRQTVNFLNEDIHEDSPVKVKSTSIRQTVNFNADMSGLSPATDKANHLRETVNFNEDIQVMTPVKSSKESIAPNGHNLNKPGSSLRPTNGQPLVVRKICTPLVNKSKTQAELDQQRMLRFKKKLEQDVVKHDAADKAPTINKSLNVSLSSVKNLSLSPDSSSPLIPSEFKVYNLKQLNDELERGNLHVYSNAPKTPSTDRMTKASSQFSKNLQCSESSKQRRTLVFDDADIPIASADDTLTNAFKSIKSQDFFEFNPTQEPAIDREKKKKAKCRYSQADDMMLDNTSFLTQAKLGDETASRNSSKRDATQINNIDISFDEPLMDAAIQLVGESNDRSPKEKSSCNSQSSECYSNVKKRHTMHLNDDIENELPAEKTQTELENRTSVLYENNMDIEDENPRENLNGKTVYVINDMEMDTEEVDQDQFKSLNDEEILSAKTLRSSSIFFKNDNPKQQKQNHLRHTLHFNNENVENEEPQSHAGMETIVGTLKGSRQTKYFDNNDIDAEIKNSPKESNARQTYTNKDIDTDTDTDTEELEQDPLKSSSHEEIHTANTLRSSTIFYKNDITNIDTENSEKNIRPQKQNHVRHTLHFDNENIENEEPQSHAGMETIVGTLKCSRQTKYFDNTDIDAETQNSPKGRIARQTLYRNNDIDTEAVAQDQLKSSNHEEIHTANTLRSSTIFYKNDITNIDNQNSENIQNIQQQKQSYSRHTLHFDNENIENEEPSGQVHGGMETIVGTFKSSRQTKYFDNNDIDGEIQNSPKERNARQTLYLNKDIEDDQCHDFNSENKQGNTNNALHKHKEPSNQRRERHLRNTMHFDNEHIDCEVAHGEQNKHSHTKTFNFDYDIENGNEQVNDLNPKYFENFQADSVEPIGESSKQNVHYNIDVTDADTFLACAGNVEIKDKPEKTRRQTLLFHQDIDLERSNLVSTEFCENGGQNNENQMSFIANTNDHHLDKETKSTFEQGNTVHFHNNTDISMDLSYKASVENHNLSECKASNKNSPSPLRKPKRRTHYYDSSQANMELSIGENDLTYDYKREIQSSGPEKNKTLHCNNNNDISREQYETSITNKLQFDKESNSSKDKMKTLHFENNNDISIDESGAPAAQAEAQYNKVPEATERPLNAGKMSLLRQSSANIGIQITPKIIRSKYQNRLNEETPGMLDFIAEEKKSQIERVEFTSPYRSKVSMKRLPSNLTPIVKMVKKRQTLMFDDCNMDVTHTPKIPENSATKSTFNVDIIGTTINDTTQEMDVSNEAVMLTTPSSAKQRRSRIPIPVSSGRKSTKSPSLGNICAAKKIIDYKEFVVDKDDGIDEEVDESLQILRRATAFTPIRDLSIEPKSHDPEFEVHQPFGGQPSKFEDNPITISDVSVFFTAQRKSNENTTVPLPDITAAMHTINISGLNAIERNRYINLTCDSPLEDIDQTRLSLVRTLSDDDNDDDNDEHDNVNKIIVEYNDTYHEHNPETETVEKTTTTTTETVPFNNSCADSGAKHGNVNNLRNVSTVCRKCKRCQDTFLNETTSSTADSFVMPALPPLPDLGLDRLRRLRTRPTISDVNVLWQRVSLDRTIINPINISDDDCQIVSDAEEDKSDEDESSPVFKALRKYHKNRQEFELKLIESLQEKKAALARQRPFVNRLEDLLSNYSNHWIFDYQKQVRGIYLFSHRRMLTFSVSLTCTEVDPLGIDVKLKTVHLQPSHVPKKNWKAIDFILDFQLKLNLPYDLLSLCEGSNEAGIFKMLQEIDRICVETVKMGQALQRVVFSNQASIIRDQSRTYVRKIIRKIVKNTDNTAQHVQKIEIKIELLNLKKLSFKDIAAPPLHNFREEIHLLPVGLQFLNVFLPNPLNYLTCANNK